jgi:hypothetical protein
VINRVWEGRRWVQGLFIYLFFNFNYFIKLMVTGKLVILIADVVATSVPHQFLIHLAEPQLEVSAFIYNIDLLKLA